VQFVYKLQLWCEDRDDYQLGDLVPNAHMIVVKGVVIELDDDGAGVSLVNDPLAGDAVLDIEAAFAFQHAHIALWYLNVHTRVYNSASKARHKLVNGRTQVKPCICGMCALRHISARVKFDFHLLPP